MGRLCARLARALLCGIALSWSMPSLAQPPLTGGAHGPNGGHQVNTAIRLEWQAPGDCSSANAFRSAVSDWTSNVAWTQDPEALLVRVSLEPDSQRGRLELIADSRSARQVERSDCEELSRALAFVLAVAIDPAGVAARAESPPEQPVPADTAPGEPPEETSKAGESAASSALVGRRQLLIQADDEPRPARAAAQASPRESAEPATGPSVSPADLTWTLATGGVVETGIGESTAPGASFRLGVRLMRPAPGGDGFSWFSPELRLGASLVKSTARQFDVFANGTKTAAIVSGCPLWLKLNSHLRIDPCVHLELGTLSMSAGGLEGAQPQTGAWRAGAGTVGLTLAIAPIEFEFALGARYNATQDVFVVEQPSSVAPVHEVPAISTVATLSVGIVFFKSGT